MELELRHLRAICAIADAGSISRAAAATSTSQPALTTALKRIERAFGGELFHRGQDGVSPTAFGSRVIAGARTVLAAADSLGRQRGGGLDGAICPITLGGTAGSVVIELACRLEAIALAGPLSITTDPSPRRLLELLGTGRLDAAVLVDHPGYAVPIPPGVQVQALGPEPVFVALPAGHPAARGEVALTELADDAWVLGPSDGAGWPEAFEMACLTAGFAPRVAHRVADLRSLQDLIAAGRAVGPCQATFRAAPGLVVRPLAGDPLWLRQLIAWRTDGPFGSESGALVEQAIATHRHALDASSAYRGWLRRRGPTIEPCPAPLLVPRPRAG